MIRISCYPNETAARTAADKLHDRNIPAVIVTEDAGNDRVISVLEVDAEHVDDAIDSLSNGPGAAAIKCPACESAHVLYPNRPEASPTANLVEKAAEVLHLTEKTFLCRSCKHEWAPDKTV